MGEGIAVPTAIQSAITTSEQCSREPTRIAQKTNESKPHTVHGTQALKPSSIGLAGFFRIQFLLQKSLRPKAISYCMTSTSQRVHQYCCTCEICGITVVRALQKYGDQTFEWKSLPSKDGSTCATSCKYKWAHTDTGIPCELTMPVDHVGAHMPWARALS